MNKKETSHAERAEILAQYNLTERFIREGERRRITSISQSAWRRYDLENLVPRKRKIGNITAWLLSDILLWLHKQL